MIAITCFVAGIALGVTVTWLFFSIAVIGDG